MRADTFLPAGKGSRKEKKRDQGRKDGGTRLFRHGRGDRRAVFSGRAEGFGSGTGLRGTKCLRSGREAPFFRAAEGAVAAFSGLQTGGETRNPAGAGSGIRRFE